ncbi:MAG: hypothetical protein M1833_003624 [Piccolia ochrophora]|nr:MAG: hypothetical protein M1833_003624 [Piccolia ochrophora]
MPHLSLSDNEFSLHGAPDADIGSRKPRSKPIQALTLDLPDDLRDALLRAAQGAGKGIQVSFGKAASLQYGSHSRHLTSSSHPFRQELYQYSPSIAEEELVFASLASHRLEVRKLESVTAGVDAAMLALQSKMAALDEAKQSKRAVLVSDDSKLQGVGSKRRMTPRANHSPSYLHANRTTSLNNANSRSIPNSPALTAQSSPPAATLVPTTSEPSQEGQKVLRSLAIKTPLLHLLALGPSTEHDLARKTRAPLNECLELLQKFGKPIRSGPGWQLADRWYKELDVWKFPYPSQNDRQAAIDNAVSAFDRLRLSREDVLWQFLLPKQQRGKGKILSKLQLHAGPIQKTNTPQIKVQRTENTFSIDSEMDVDKYCSDGASTTQGLSAAQPLSSQEGARSKSPDPPAKKKGRGTETASKRIRSDSLKDTNKGGGKDKNVKSSNKGQSNRFQEKFKSAEYIHDSDEDLDMEDAMEQSQNKASNDTSSSQVKPEIPKPSSGDVQKLAERQWNEDFVDEKQHASQSRADSSSKSSSSNESSRTCQSSPSRRDVSRRSTNNSPPKPSPLGSSPPTNASDLDSEPYAASSSSSSPLILQARRAAEPAAPRSSHIPRHENQPRLNGLPKRKTEYPDSSQHQLGKRQRISTAASDSYSSSSASPPSNLQTVVLAQRFKAYHAKYNRLYRELANAHETPPQEKVKRVVEMHKRLETMKVEIARSAGLT